MSISRSMRRVMLIAVGSISVALGVIGAFVPILPTTPFLLLAAACYARSSERLHRWLFTNRLFGRYLRDYTEGKGLPLLHKTFTLLLLWLAIGWSVFHVLPDHLGWVKCLLWAIAVAVTIHVLRIRTRMH